MTRNRKKSTGERGAGDIATSFVRSTPRTFAGYAVDIEAPTRVFTIDLLVDGRVVRSVVANEYVHELVERGIGNGCYGFSLSLPDNAVDNAHVIEARIANLGHRIGQPIVLDEPHREGPGIEGPGTVRWLGGLRFSGWIDDGDPAAPVADVLVDGALVTRVKALGWAHVGHDSDSGRAVRSFDLHLPERFADGCVHRLSMVRRDGTALGSADVPFVAFADGLAQAISDLGQLDSERLRGELFDLLLPMSLPLAAYDEWRQRFPIETPERSVGKSAIILVGPGNVNKSLLSLDEQTHDDWVAASLNVSGQQLALDPDETATFLNDDGQDCAFVVFALAGTVFESNALARIVEAFEAFGDAEIVYGDVDTAARDGSRWPLAFPAFDYERMLEQGYCAHFFAIRRNAATAALAGGASNLYRLFNSVLDDGASGSDAIVHLPGALGVIPAIDIPAASRALQEASAAHLNARGISAGVEPGNGAIMPAVRVFRSPSAGRTTVVIPTRDRLSLLQRCIETIQPALERVSADILIVDNGSSDPATLNYLTEIEGDGVSVLRVDGPFNFARLNNLAAAAASGEFLCLLNNDIEATDDLWLEEMLGRLAEPDVGAVGALLLWPSGVVQHGGVVLGPSFAAHHAFNDRVEADPGFGDLLRVAHECSAVTAACLLTRRNDYLDAGGMDEAKFAVAFNDVDYCLKLRALGKRIILSPHARLLHLESASRGSDNRPERKARFQRELQLLRARWGDVLLDDPYYSPLLSLDPVPFSALAWPPRSRQPRVLRTPVVYEVPPGF